MAYTALSAFIVALPKAELHLHLEGSIDPSTVLELKKRHGKKGTLAEVGELYRYKDFTGFLLAFKTVTEELQTPEDYELVTYRLMEKLKADNALHAEVYVSVGVCLWRKQDFDAIFTGLERGRQRGERDFGISLLWIFDAVRQSVRTRRSKLPSWRYAIKTQAWLDSELAETNAKPLLNCFEMCMPMPRRMAFGLRRTLAKPLGRDRYGVHSICPPNVSVTGSPPLKIPNWWKHCPRGRFRWRFVLRATCAPGYARRLLSIRYAITSIKV
jgi:hypothetical protein